jgi:hypothetical protein
MNINLSNAHSRSVRHFIHIRGSRVAALVNVAPAAIYALIWPIANALVKAVNQEQ